LIQGTPDVGMHRAEQGLEHGQRQPAGKAAAKRPKRPHN